MSTGNDSVTMDPYSTSSIWDGVTTTVVGNCGFAIAPYVPLPGIVERPLGERPGWVPRHFDR